MDKEVLPGGDERRDRSSIKVIVSLVKTELESNAVVGFNRFTHLKFFDKFWRLGCFRFPSID